MGVSESDRAKLWPLGDLHRFHGSGGIWARGKGRPRILDTRGGAGDIALTPILGMLVDERPQDFRTPCREWSERKVSNDLAQGLDDDVSGRQSGDRPTKAYP